MGAVPPASETPPPPTRLTLLEKRVSLRWACLFTIGMSVLLWMVLTGWGPNQAISHGDCTADADRPYKASGEIKFLGRMACGHGNRHGVIRTCVMPQRKVSGSWVDYHSIWPCDEDHKVSTGAYEWEIECRTGKWRTRSKGEAGYYLSGSMVREHIEGPVNSRAKSISC